jgi:hypothetical protein
MSRLRLVEEESRGDAGQFLWSVIFPADGIEPAQ